MDDSAPYPLYNSTFTLYRVSPLYNHGEPTLLSEASLRTHARRLRDILKGDNVRGVETNFFPETTASSNIGPLQECTWTLLGDEAAWLHDRSVESTESASQEQQPPATLTPSTARGISITLRYPRTTYAAHLLRSQAHTPTTPGFTHLPLLLLRMPASIRDVVLDHLRSTFDTHIAPLSLPSHFLTHALENLLAHLSPPHQQKTSATADPHGTQTLPAVVKNLQIQLQFPHLAKQGKAHLLRNIDVAIARDDVAGFLRRGRSILMRRKQGTVASAEAVDEQRVGPFTHALAAYLDAHLALSILAGAGVEVGKIACGAFALGAEGKVKLFVPPPANGDGESVADGLGEMSPAQRAMEGLIEGLVGLAERRKVRWEWMDGGDGGKGKGKGRVGVKERGGGRGKRKRVAVDDEDEEEEDDDVRMRGAQARRGQASSEIPADPPPPYELHDPAAVVGAA